MDFHIFIYIGPPCVNLHLERDAIHQAYLDS